MVENSPLSEELMNDSVKFTGHHFLQYFVGLFIIILFVNIFDWYVEFSTLNIFDSIMVFTMLLLGLGLSIPFISSHSKIKDVFIISFYVEGFILVPLTYIIIEFTDGHLFNNQKEFIPIYISLSVLSLIFSLIIYGWYRITLFQMFGQNFSPHSNNPDLLAQLGFCWSCKTAFLHIDYCRFCNDILISQKDDSIIDPNDFRLVCPRCSSLNLFNSQFGTCEGCNSILEY